MPPRRGSSSLVLHRSSGTAPGARTHSGRSRIAFLAGALLASGIVLAGVAAPATADAPPIEERGTIALAAIPLAIVASPSGDLVYVIDADGTLSVIDTATDTVQREIAVGITGTTAMIGSPDGGLLFVLDGSSDTMAIVDTETDAVSPVVIGSGFSMMQVSPNGAVLYVSAFFDQVLQVIDTASATVTRTVGLPEWANAYALSPDGATLYLGQYPDGVLAMSTVDFQTWTLGSPGYSTKAALSPDGATLYTINSVGFVHSFGATTGTTNYTLLRAANITDAIAVSADSSELYRVNTMMSGGSSAQTYTSDLSIIDATSGITEDTVDLGGRHSMITVDSSGTYLWITGAAGASVVELASASRSSRAIGGGVAGVAVMPDAGRAYAISASAEVVYVLALALPELTPASRTIAATFGEPVVPTAAWTAANFGGAVAYAVSPALPAGLVLDPATGSVSGTPTGPVQGATDYAVTGTGATSGAATVTLSVSVAAASPSAPGTVSATAGAGQAFVSWSAPSSDGGAAVSSYTATATPGGASCTTTGMSCVVPGLVSGTSYTFTVEATNSVGTSLASTPSSPVSVVASVAPSNPPASTFGTSVRLVAANGSAVTSLVAGQQFFVEVTGFAPASSVEATLYSTPVRVGAGVTDGAGAARFGVTIPSILDPGAHTLVVSGFGSSGQTAFAAVGVTTPGVAAAAPTRRGLANSGGEPDASFPAAAILLLVVGGALLAATRRVRARAL